MCTSAQCWCVDWIRFLFIFSIRSNSRKFLVIVTWTTTKVFSLIANRPTNQLKVKFILWRKISIRNLNNRVRVCRASAQRTQKVFLCCERIFPRNVTRQSVRLSAHKRQCACGMCPWIANKQKKTKIKNKNKATIITIWSIVARFHWQRLHQTVEWPRIIPFDIWPAKWIMTATPWFYDQTTTISTHLSELFWRNCSNAVISGELSQNERERKVCSAGNTHKCNETIRWNWQFLSEIPFACRSSRRETENRKYEIPQRQRSSRIIYVGCSQEVHEETSVCI